MTPRRVPSPWLGGPGARWAQALLLVLHAALLGALGICLWTFLAVLPRLDFEPWQKFAFFAGIGVSLAFFGARAVRIGADLWAARPGAPAPPPSEEDGED
jgi:hypothetical protein